MGEKDASVYAEVGGVKVFIAVLLSHRGPMTVLGLAFILIAQIAGMISLDTIAALYYWG